MKTKNYLLILIPALGKYIRQFIVIVCAGWIFGFFTAIAQPSGGPYGPIRQHYELPETKGKIYYVAPDGSADETGEYIDKPTTVEQAIKRIVSGDAIVMRGGTYRTGNLVLNQGIVIQPYRNEKPVLKGTLVATEWEDLGNGLWVTDWKFLFPMEPASWWRREREGIKTPLHRFNNDMVFVDGKFLQSAGWEGELDKNSYYIDYNAKKIYIGTDPTDRLVEITAHDVGLHRVTEEVHGERSDGKGPVIRGITFTQYAYRALEIDGTEPKAISAESDHGKEVTGTILEHCELSYCSRVAAYLRGDGLIIRQCKISNTSTEGIYIIASSDVLLEENIFTGNNIERITGYFPAAVKIFNQSYRVACNNNLVLDHPYSNGIWYDVGCVDAVFTNNWVENVGFTDREFIGDKPWPSDNGFFFEISKGAVCAGNVFVNCDQGIFVLNSSDVSIYNNTFVNSILTIGRNERVPQGDHFGWHSASGPGIDERDGHIVMNNLLTGDSDFEKPLLFVWQPDLQCKQLPDPMLEKLDHNVFLRNPEAYPIPLILWSPAENEKCQTGFNTLNGFRQVFPEFSVNSLYFNANEPLFKSLELDNYTLLREFPGFKAAAKLPKNIKNLTGSSKVCYIGAYP